MPSFAERLDQNAHDGLMVADAFAHLIGECDTVTKALTLSERIEALVALLNTVQRAALERSDTICRVDDAKILAGMK